jgi:predicted adenylyl cyclase CyaB
MIEVEVRGRLTQEQYENLKTTLAEKGEAIRHLEREMILLLDYPGYDQSSLHREMDIRLRNTSGECEIMVKRKAGDNNVGREEISLGLQGTDLITARRVFSALGFRRGVRMVRSMDQYSYGGAEWQVVATPKGLWYYEVEKGVENESEVTGTHEELTEQAQALGLSVMTPEELQSFIDLLGREVNEEVEL